MRSDADEHEGAGARMDTPAWKLSLPGAPNDVVFYTASAVGLACVLVAVVNRFSGSDALLIVAMLPPLALFAYLIRRFSAIPRPNAAQEPGRAPVRRPRSTVSRGRAVR